MIGSEEFRDRVVELCVKRGVKGLPPGKRDRHIVLKSVAMTMDPHRGMTVEEVDAALNNWIGMVAQRLEVDRVTLRRALINEGYLRSDREGVFYTLYSAGPDGPEYSGAVEKLDVFDIALHAVCQVEQDRFDKFPKPDSAEGKKLIKARIVARHLLAEQVPVNIGCYFLSCLFDRKCPFLSELVYFEDGFSSLVDDGRLARKYAFEFLEKSDEWVFWLDL